MIDQTEGQDLFDVRLTASGKVFIRKFATTVRALILIGIIISLIFIASTIIRIVKFNPDMFAGNSLLRFQYRIFPYYALFYTILFFFQLYYYWKVGKCLQQGAGYNDEAAFNDSFTALYRNAVFGIATLSLSLLMNLLEFYLLTKYYLN